MAWTQLTDIYEARPGSGQKNGGLTVYPGSPSWPTGTNAGSRTTNYGLIPNMLSYPPVTGTNTANQPGGGPTNAISGQYSFCPSGRFDDPRYYAATGTGPIAGGYPY